MASKIKKILEKLSLEKYGYNFLESMQKKVSEKKYEENLKKWYKNLKGEELNLENPKNFTEKLQWLKLYDSTPLKSQLTDKYLVREWVKEEIGEEYLIPLLGVWDNAKDINFDLLPNEFILKANHGCSWNIIVKDKNTIDQKKIRKQLNKWLSYNYGYRKGLELHYRPIKPKIIAEELIKEIDNSDLKDYKIHCFAGKVKIIEIISNRSSKDSKLDLYFDTKWNLMPIDVFTVGGWHPHPYKYFEGKEDGLKPKNLDKMLELSEKLSKQFPYVRVDFYNIEGKIFFGEMTFTPVGGADSIGTEEWLNTLGDWITLPKEKQPFPR